jgi:hypothetical protein
MEEAQMNLWLNFALLLFIKSGLQEELHMATMCAWRWLSQLASKLCCVANYAMLA